MHQWPAVKLQRTAESPRVEKEDLHQSYVLHVGKNKETDPFYITAEQVYLCSTPGSRVLVLLLLR